MRTIAIVVFLLGIALAGGGAYYAMKLFEKYEALANRPVQRVETMRILVAARDIGYGESIKRDFVTWADWPMSSIPSGAYNDENAFFGQQASVTRSATQNIIRGEPILGSKVTQLGERANLAARLSPGMRAFSFAIGGGLAGLVQVGDRVDILLTRKIGESLRTEVFMKNVTLIAIDQRTDVVEQSRRVGRTATVEVKPIDVSKLTIAQTEGRLSIALRGTTIAEDPAAEEVAPVDADELFERPKEVVKEEVKAPTVRLRRGTEVMDVEIDN